MITSLSNYENPAEKATPESSYYSKLQLIERNESSINSNLATFLLTEFPVIVCDCFFSNDIKGIIPRFYQGMYRSVVIDIDDKYLSKLFY